MAKLKLFIALACAAVASGCMTTQNPHSTVASDSPGFSVLETDHATLLAEPGVSDSSEREVGQLFEIGYQTVSEDLGGAERRPRLYVYASAQSMYQDLVTRWGYPEWVRRAHTIPRMHRDYIEWIPPRQHQDIAFITHEYSHRIIEQIAGLNSQVRFKWFDEGLAECEGQRALAKWSPIQAESQKTDRMHFVAIAYASNALIRFEDITTEQQWSRQIERGGHLAYTEAWAALDYLISWHGIEQVKSVLNLIGRGRTFADAFGQIYGITVEEFESSFRFSVQSQRKDD